MTPSRGPLSLTCWIPRLRTNVLRCSAALHPPRPFPRPRRVGFVVQLMKCTWFAAKLRSAHRGPRRTGGPRRSCRTLPRAGRRNARSTATARSMPAPAIAPACSSSPCSARAGSREVTSITHRGRGHPDAASSHTSRGIAATRLRSRAATSARPAGRVHREPRGARFSVRDGADRVPGSCPRPHDEYFSSPVVAGGFRTLLESTSADSMPPLRKQRILRRQVVGLPTISESWS